MNARKTTSNGTIEKVESGFEESGRSGSVEALGDEPLANRSLTTHHLNSVLVHVVPPCNDVGCGSGLAGPYSAL